MRYFALWAGITSLALIVHFTFFYEKKFNIDDKILEGCVGENVIHTSLSVYHDNFEEYKLLKKANELCKIKRGDVEAWVECKTIGGCVGE